MPDQRALEEFRERVLSELRNDILPFWLRHAPDEEFGGFRGRISNDLVIDRRAEKGLILNARILWTFSRAYRAYQEKNLCQAADRAYYYMMRFFRDPQFGGFYWLVDFQGRSLDASKKTYGQAFTIYALAEYCRIADRQGSLEEAIRLFRQVENASRDAQFGGYFETCNSDWSLAEDQRLSPVDMNEKKSMNTHLHVLEAYTNLYRVWKDETLRLRLRDLVRIFVDRILNPESCHFRLFFDDRWTPRSDRISFGHDIEGSWLLCEAAEVLGDADLLRQVKAKAVEMADRVRREAIDADGGLHYEADPQGIIDTDKHWWPQAEAGVGFMNAWQINGDEAFFTASRNCWDFIEEYLIDRQHGEWFWKVSSQGTPSQDKFKVDVWKCPYHNARTCFEVLERLK